MPKIFSFDEELTLAKARVERHLAAILVADVTGYSRLMGADEVGTLAQLRTQRGELLDPAIERHRGHIANTAGDSILAEFGSVVDAVTCAVEIQRSMFERNSETPPDQRIEFRIGINLGDVISEGTDIFGDGVNIASRLESIADRGGICISRQVLDQVEGKLDLTYRELGRQNLEKHRQASGGLRDPSWCCDIAGLPVPRHREPQAGDTLLQGTRRCPAGIRDGRQWTADVEIGALAWSSRIRLGIANFPAFIIWTCPGSHTGQIRCPRQRPVGLDVPEISLDAWVSDMETVAQAAGLNRFPLFGFSQGCPVAIAYAVRHPERVSHLILYGGFATGTNKRSTLTATGRERLAAMNTLVKQGWGADNPAFRQIFTSLLIPTANKDQADAFNELQRLSASPECAARYLETVGNLTVLDLLSQVKAPTLVMHVRDDSLVPIKLGRELAAGIPGARFVALPGKNHVPLEQDPGVPRLFEELNEFLLAADARG